MTILVPTDFSENARNALVYAMHLARQFDDSDVHFAHCFNYPKRAGVLLSVDTIIREDAAKTLRELIATYGEGRKIQTHILKGEAVSMLAGLADQLEADLIVMGTQGMTHATDIFLGSTTSGLTGRNSRPVLAIPQDFQYRPPSRIVFAIDDFDISRQSVLASMTRIARAFKSHVFVFHLEKGKEDAGIDPSVNIFLDALEHSFHYEMENKDLQQSIREFVQDYEGDMLCMIRRKRGFFERIIHPSATRQEVFHCKVPLLILHDVK